MVSGKKIVIWGADLTMLSVLMFCPQFAPIVGGAERQAEKLAIALGKKGCRVRIITPKLVESSPLYEEYDGIEVQRYEVFDLTSNLPWARGLGIFNLMLLKYKTIKAVDIAIEEFDIVHLHMVSPITGFALLAAKRHRKKVICKVAMAGKKNDFTELRRVGYGMDRIASKFISEVDVWVATTNPVKDVLLEQGILDDRIAAIPNGVLIEPCERLGLKSNARFLYLGRLSSTAERDVETMIDAFDLLSKIDETSELAIVGDGDYFSKTKEFVESKSCSDRVKMPGLQNPQEWLSWANCFVLPSRREGLSNALLEAMACGLACIANDIPANREVLDDGRAGMLSVVEDLDSMYGCMLTLSSDPNNVEKWSRLARDRAVNEYSINGVVDRYLSLYARILDADYLPPQTAAKN